MKALGLDVGGTRIKSYLVDVEDIKDTSKYRILSSKIFKTYAYKGRDEILKNIVKAITYYNNYKTFAYIGVASAGTIDFSTGSVIFATDNLPNFTGLELGKTITKAIDKRVVVINDAQAAALGECNYGNSFDEYKNVLFVTLGTGLGSSIITNKTHLKDIHLGHITLHENGRECTCHKIGCAECYVSAQALRKNANIPDLEIIFNSQEENCIKARRDFYIDFTDTLEYAVNNYTIDCIVVGGGVIEMANYWWDDFMSYYSKKLSTPIFKAQLANVAGSIGASFAAINKKIITSEV